MSATPETSEITPADDSWLGLTACYMDRAIVAAADAMGLGDALNTDEPSEASRALLLVVYRLAQARQCLKYKLENQAQADQTEADDGEEAVPS